MRPGLNVPKSHGPADATATATERLQTDPGVGAPARLRSDWPIQPGDARGTPSRPHHHKDERGMDDVRTRT